MITLKNVTLRRSAKVLLNSATVTLNPGEKVGLVGRNGAGKSTLFALFNGTLHEDGGDFSLPKAWRMAQVAQNMPETDEPASTFVLEGDTRLAELRQRLIQAEASGDGMEMAHVYTDLADAGDHDALPRAQALILGLGFRVDELNKPVNSFSGGWRMRLQLARALMCPSDILLLDEPTNHLDLDALVWLEAWLKRYSGTMIVISHDREFLDAVTAGSADAGLIIHEAQLTYNKSGFYKALDLGKDWKERYGLPLPLGCNVLKRSLAPDIKLECCRMMRESIQYALDHHSEALEYAMQFARDMEPRLAEQFIGMYVNHYTVDAGETIPKAAQLLYDKGFEVGLLPHKVEVEFARG